MNTELYNQLLAIKREKELSTRGLARECGLSYGMMIEFFDKTRIFRPLRDTTMAKIHNNLGISYEIMEEYNKEILKERG